MAICEHNGEMRYMPDELVASLPECQAGLGRHKCAICAYHEGLDGRFDRPSELVTSDCSHHVPAPIMMLKNLADSQGTTARHKCVYTAYQLGVSQRNSNRILQDYESQTKANDETEALAEIKVRKGQQMFRKALLKHWNSKCAVTNIDEPLLLKASHMRPWSKCESNSQRLDVYNGLLLSANWDAAFDAGLVSFKDDGNVLYCSKLSPNLKSRFANDWSQPIKLVEPHRPYLKWHRDHVFKT